MKRLLVCTLPLLITVILLNCGPSDEVAAERSLKLLEYRRSGEAKDFSRWLSNRNPNTRQRALETLARIQDVALLPQMSEGLNDESPSVRSAAAYALGQLFDAEAEGPLLKALQTEIDPSVRVSIIEALGKSGARKAADRLSDFIEASEVDLRKAAILSIGQLAHRGQLPLTLPQALGPMVRDNDSEIAWRSAYAMYRLSAIQYFTDLDTGLDNPQPLVRFFSLNALRQITAMFQSPKFNLLKSQPGYKVLHQRFISKDYRDRLSAQLNAEDGYVVVAALEVFQRLRDDNYQPQITRLLTHPHPHVRVSALQTLARFKNPNAWKSIEQVYRGNDDWRLRGEALALLSSRQPGETMARIKKDWLQQPWPQQYYAIRALDSLKSLDPGKSLPAESEATRLLIDIANNGTSASVTLALEALMVRNNPPDIDFFMGRLKSGDPAIVTIIANYFSQLEAPRPTRAAGPLVQAYKQFELPRDLEPMESIIVALDSIHSQEVAPFLNEQLSSPYKGIRESARSALENLSEGDTIILQDIPVSIAARSDLQPASPDSTYLLTFTTSAGEFTMTLLPGQAPLNCGNIVSLARTGFYNGIAFHRVIPGFVAQAGDPRGDGWGGPGYAVLCEYGPIPYERGVVGMALSGKDTGGSQFFITYTPQPHLNGRYTILGRISKGMNVIDRIEKFDIIERVTVTVAVQ